MSRYLLFIVTFIFIKVNAFCQCKCKLIYIVPGFSANKITFINDSLFESNYYDCTQNKHGYGKYNLKDKKLILKYEDNTNKYTENNYKIEFDSPRDSIDINICLVDNEYFSGQLVYGYVELYKNNRDNYIDGYNIDSTGCTSIKLNKSNEELILRYFTNNVEMFDTIYQNKGYDIHKVVENTEKYNGEQILNKGEIVEIDFVKINKKYYWIRKWKSIKDKALKYKITCR